MLAVDAGADQVGVGQQRPGLGRRRSGRSRPARRGGRTGRARPRRACGRRPSRPAPGRGRAVSTARSTGHSSTACTLGAVAAQRVQERRDLLLAGGQVLVEGHRVGAAADRRPGRVAISDGGAVDDDLRHAVRRRGRPRTPAVCLAFSCRLLGVRRVDRVDRAFLAAARSSPGVARRARRRRVVVTEDRLQHLRGVRRRRGARSRSARASACGTPSSPCLAARRRSRGCAHHRRARCRAALLPVPGDRCSAQAISPATNSWCSGAACVEHPRRSPGTPCTNARADSRAGRAQRTRRDPATGRTAGSSHRRTLGRGSDKTAAQQGHPRPRTVRAIGWRRRSSSVRSTTRSHGSAQAAASAPADQAVGGSAPEAPAVCSAEQAAQHE